VSGGNSIVGVDSGGTFTDLVAFAGDGELTTAKVFSTPHEPAGAVNVAIDRAQLGGAIERLVHGTTVATNAILQRSGARLCLLTTAGFEDITYIQRINRPHAYSLHWSKPKPLVRRRMIIGVDERIDAQGAVVKPLTEGECERVVAQVRTFVERDGVDAVALCLLFSYLNDSHERLLEARLAADLPELPVSRSSRISPIWREYERTSTVLADAFVRPLMTAYLQQLDGDLGRRGRFPLLVMKSNGGMGKASSVARVPVTTILSGLAGGAVAGAYFGRGVGEPRCVTFDMGGTSTDVALVEDGVVGQASEYEIEWGLPVVTPVVDVRAIGAGGGSIARVDEGGLLRVGPESAGADPGPACYATGGTAATVTDANVVLGRLNSEYFLGGEMPLDPQAATATIAEVGRRAGLGVIEAGLAIVGIANENMANAIRLVTIERGVDPRDYALIAFGGAGPLHACGVADAVGIDRVVIPPHPGLCSAFGAGIARLQVDRSWSLSAQSDDLDETELRERFLAAEADAVEELRADGLKGEIGIRRTLECRYYLQNYEQEVRVPNLEPGFLKLASAAFHDLHRAFFGYAFEQEPVEVVHCRVSVYDQQAHVHYNAFAATAAAEEVGVRQVVSPAGEPLQTHVFRRGRIAETIEGPAVIEERDSTTYIPGGWSANQVANGAILLTRGGAD
jgi:N-methylhydantoinase A